jgi:hypothetical protein
LLQPPPPPPPAGSLTIYAKTTVHCSPDSSMVNTNCRWLAATGILSVVHLTIN